MCGVVAAGLLLGLVIPTALNSSRGSFPTGWTGYAPIRPSAAPGVYTFAQAVKAGIVPSLEEQLKESGLPLCGTKGPTGAKARAALKKVIVRNDGDTCMADPRQTTISICCAPRPHPCAVSLPSATLLPSLGPGVDMASDGLLVSSPLEQSGISIPAGARFRFPDAPGFWRALGRTNPKLPGDAFLAQIGNSEAVHSLAHKAGPLVGKYLVLVPHFAPGRGPADTDPWGGAIVTVNGYSNNADQALRLANRITLALCNYVVAHTPSSLTGEQRFQPEPLPTSSTDVARIAKTPATARTF